jgi:hypothetical protein
VRRRLGTLALAAFGLAGCAEREPPRERRLERVELAADGRSAAIAIDVPVGTRSLTLVVDGDDDALYGLASLVTADGVERIGLPDGSVGPMLARAYRDERVGRLPGRQSVRLGLFTHVYPARPGEALPAGRTVVRLASDRPGPVSLRALMPPDDGAARLPVALVTTRAAAGAAADDPAWLADAAELLRPAVEVEVVEVIELPIGPIALTEVSEPQEPPDSESAALLAEARRVLGSDALAIVVVDDLPTGLGGWSLGTPGPPLPGTPYSGVVIERGGRARMARVAAHELAHYLGAAHVVDRGASGARYDDGLDDTEPGEGNLMDEAGDRLSPAQAFVLRRSALLR